MRYNGLGYENTVDTSATWFSGRRTSRYLLGNQLIYGVERAPINPDLSSAQVPVILFSHGLLGFRNSHSSLFSDLASKGFIVIAMEHRYTSLLSYSTERPIETEAPQQPLFLMEVPSR